MNIDLRAVKTEKIKPPFPLPHVSRKALRRVKNPLPAPKTCRYCGPEVPVLIEHHSVVYGGRSYGDWPYVYRCLHCRAYVGLHPHTDLPLGTLADEELRKARKQNKAIFNRLMAQAVLSRSEAYQWLAEAMSIPVGECHWGWFEIEQCELAGQLCEQRLAEVLA
ncbi:zinc-finger-containing protein [Marinobacter sp. MDS2]|uniref:zinc-finger-containing protein n=1 Tax=Marinobacter sp. MDS2 TaxID=3065961 RepID=UPI00273BB810|nr:zinc-finger-containing protein [Marinobacter sp. MDS2]MDP4546524.1 zinc-finger-containing protein [Marinobacter sp. MDS2]